MDFSYTPEQEAFRVRLRDWLKRNSAEVFGQHYEKLPRSVAGVFQDCLDSSDLTPGSETFESCAMLSNAR